MVISGIKEDLTTAELIFMNNGAKKFIYLNVSAAFHSKIMKKAEMKMKKVLSKVDFKDPSYPIISNFSAKDSKKSRVLNIKETPNIKKTRNHEKS